MDAQAGHQVKKWEDFMETKSVAGKCYGAGNRREEIHRVIGVQLMDRDTTNISMMRNLVL